MFRRFQIDLAIPVDEEGHLPPALHRKLNEILTPQQLQALANMEVIDVVKAMLQRLKEFAAKINEGTDREEDSVRARWHLCRHDIGESCEGEEEI